MVEQRLESTKESLFDPTLQKTANEKNSKRHFHFLKSVSFRLTKQ